MSGKKESLGVAGSVFIRPPKMTHEEYCTSKVGLKVQVIFWKPRSPQRVGRLPEQSFDAKGHILHAMTWLYDLQERIDLGHDYMDELLGLILLECAESAQPRLTNRWSKVTAYIHENLAEPLSLSLLAQMVGMNKNYFVEEFHRDMGISPMAYVRKARLDRACRTITQTDTVFREVARETGFRDEFEFSRVFRRVMGFSPGRLRALKSGLPSNKKKPSK